MLEISFITISIWVVLLAEPMGQILSPMTFIGISSIQKLALPASLIVQNWSQIVSLLLYKEQTLRSIGYSFREIPSKILMIFCDHLSLPMGHSVFPLPAVVQVKMLD